MENNENKKEQELNKTTYTVSNLIGSGSFGSVYKATDNKTGQTVAIKKVFQDKRYKNRELSIMSELDHPAVVKLLRFFYTEAEKKGDVYLNLVMEFVPDSLFRTIRQYQKARTAMPELQLKIYSYQLIRALNYLQVTGISHRDIKPQNVIVNADTGELKICDFGSAKILEKGKPNIAYICSRYYRAPELIFGATEYDCAIDMWSTGCVIGEMVLLRPLFAGDTSVDQLVEIINILGSPTKEQVLIMNPQSKEFKFPKVAAKTLQYLFKRKTGNEQFIDLLGKMLTYEPEKRIKPLEALAHPFFDELREEKCALSNGVMPDLFYFSKEELKADYDGCKNLTPKWYKA